MELGVATLETDLDGALGLGWQALALAEAGRAVLLSASLEADALVLGSLQQVSSLRQRSPARFEARILRRATSGTEAQLSGPLLYHALALPRVDALFPDASSRTLLNRNLRAMLRGYTAAGVPLRYFGTEVLALLGHPVALVGYDQLGSGAVLVEVLVGLENPCVVRSALKREPPAALHALLRREPPRHDLLRAVIEGVVTRLGASAVDVTADLGAAIRTTRELPEAAAEVCIPLGVVEAVVSPQARLFGDLLVSSAALSRVEAAAQAALECGGELGPEILTPLEGAALDGARPADLLTALVKANGKRAAP